MVETGARERWKGRGGSGRIIRFPRFKPQFQIYSPGKDRLEKHPLCANDSSEVY